MLVCRYQQDFLVRLQQHFYSLRNLSELLAPNWHAAGIAKQSTSHMPTMPGACGQPRGNGEAMKEEVMMPKHNDRQGRRG
jgi:hypothetical protein